MSTQNKSLIFAQIPTGWPVAGKDIKIENRPIDLDAEPPKDGLIVRNFYTSFDPYQRGRMRSSEIKSYSPPYQLGEPIANSTISKVLKSGSSEYKEGDLIQSYMSGPTQEYSLLSAEHVKQTVHKISNPHGVDPVNFLGALGMPGLTAYSSFYAIAEPKKGQTIFISSASGAVGQIVGQLAKKEGMKVIGSVGDDAKVDFIVKELNFDGGFNYKKENAADGLKRLAPNGIDVYYENVGGEQLEAAINAMNPFGRIVACGMVSQYNLQPQDAYPLRNMMQFIAKRIKMQGFIVGDPNMGPIYTKDHKENIGKWLADGSFKAKVSVTEGIDNAPDGLLGMLAGKNFGKAVLRIADLNSS